MVSFFFTFSSFFFFFSLSIHVSSAVDTISANFTLSGDQTLVSSGGTFEMGFFAPGRTSSNFYIGMWYHQLSQQTVVWVANRDKPVSDKNNSVLKISNGNLVLLEGETLVWSTGLTSSSAHKAVLLDDGNLVLRDDSGSALWQSFDHPGDTWLPGVKIRFNKRTKKSQRLTSWKNVEDPSPGLFSLELDESTAYKILWNGSTQYWTSGAWNPQSRIFDLVPEMRLNYIYNFSFFSDATESYFTYTVYNHANVSRLTLDLSGQIKQLSWLDNIKLWNLFWSQPRQQCKVYAYCGSYGICNDKSQPFCQCPHGFRPKSERDWALQDYSGGCVRKTELRCSNQFLPLPNVKLPDKSEVLERKNLTSCLSDCLRNCSCEAYAHVESSDRCLMWSYKDVLNLQQLEEDNSEGNSTFYLRLDASDMPSSSSSSGKSNKAMIVGAVVGVIALVLLVVILILRYRGRQVMRGEKSDGTLGVFSYRELQNATKNFSEKLGGGGFGSVFKGGLQDSSDIAVKRLEGISQGEKQFRTEVVTIGTIQHMNLSENERVRFFPSLAATVLTKDGDIRSLLDPRLEGEQMDIEELTRACKVACWCIQDEESHRPAMSQVVQILEGVLEVNKPPFPRSIQALVENDGSVVFFTESSSSSSHNSSQKQSHSSSSSNSPSSKKTTENM
ncbi:hypothetical protein Bca52824_034841 [Brassica carinata]|uniref:Receptor-like serine/threonine-protein kinase n=1 Tax=Brassica carinata TaxID=52824 RepID=A0A8X7S0P8_BRACI|nr:hypothetical protein Bca52824_034841 [Brassica carinata]